MILHSRRTFSPRVASVLLVFPSLVLAQQGLPDISASGSLSARAVSKGEAVQFTVVIKNKADARTKPAAAAEKLQLRYLPPQYELEKICVLPVLASQTDPCRSAAQFASAQNAIWPSLGPGQSITVHGYLKSAKPLKASVLTVSLVWDAPTPGSSIPVTLGENQVLDWYQADWLVGLTKILAVPIVLALVTFFLNWLASSKEKREAKRQKLREDAKAQAEKEQSVRTETWKQMLLISHQYAAKCYLPLSLAAERLAENLLALGTPEGDERVTFYYVLVCGKEMAKTRREIGGLYFKDLRGERLAGACWKRHRQALMGRNEAGDFNLAIRNAVDRIAGTESYAAFKKQFEVKVAAGQPPAFNDPDIQAAWEGFMQWRQNNGQAIADVVRCLRGFSAIMDYESNRPYKYWYDVPDRLDISDDLKNLFRDLRGSFSQQEINDYIAGRESAPAAAA